MKRLLSLATLVPVFCGAAWAADAAKQLARDFVDDGVAHARHHRERIASADGALFDERGCIDQAHIDLHVAAGSLECAKHDGSDVERSGD